MMAQTNISICMFGISKNIPNDDTIAEIEEVQEMKKNSHLRKSFESVEALFEDLNNDE